MKIIFTLCSNNYLAQAKTLGDSILTHNPDYHFIIGLVDKIHPNLNYSFFHPHEIVEIEKINLESSGEMLARYNIIEFNTAVKPFYFQYLFANYECESITYLDPDIKVYSSLAELEQFYQEYDFILTPHLLIANPTERPEKEQLSLNVGVFNLGFLGLRRSNQVNLFLRFFADRLKDMCYIDFCNGLFVDQIWANCIPCYFDKVLIWKDFGCNVAYWNFDERQLTMSGNKYIINNNYPLKFFHLSNYNPLYPQLLCKWLPYTFDKRPDLIPLYEEYRTDLLQNNYEKLSKLQPLLSFKVESPVTNVREYSQWNKTGLRLKNYFSKSIKFIFNV